jgi:hypothetical protein
MSYFVNGWLSGKNFIRQGYNHASPPSGANFERRRFTSLSNIQLSACPQFRFAVQAY